MAEYRALLRGLERARELGATEVELVNDSELVAPSQVQGAYKVKHPGLRPLYDQAMEALRGFERWSVRSVPRAQNAHADQLVNAALDARASEPATEYAGYLRIDDLLELQHPLTPGGARRAAVHHRPPVLRAVVQADPARARARRTSELRGGPPAGARSARCRRTVAIERLLLDHLDVLETMGPEGFLEFRDPLAPASGFQSRAVPRDRGREPARSTTRSSPPPGCPTITTTG